MAGAIKVGTKRGTVLNKHKLPWNTYSTQTCGTYFSSEEHTTLCLQCPVYRILDG